MTSPDAQAQPIVTCPDWMAKILSDAMDDLLKNRTIYFPGDHRIQVDGVKVVMVAPHNPGDSFEVRADEYNGRRWRITVDRTNERYFRYG